MRDSEDKKILSRLSKGSTYTFWPMSELMDCSKIQIWTSYAKGKPNSLFWPQVDPTSTKERTWRRLTKAWDLETWNSTPLGKIWKSPAMSSGLRRTMLPNLRKYFTLCKEMFKKKNDLLKESEDFINTWIPYWWWWENEKWKRDKWEHKSWKEVLGR